MIHGTSLDGLLNTIQHADCVTGMGQLPEGCVDLAFADPPFNIGYDYDVYHDARGRRDYLDWSKQWIGAVYRALRQSGTFWLAIGDEYAAELKLFSQDIGFHCRSWVVWYYTFGVNCKKKFSRSHAHLFYFVKDEGQFTFQDLENRVDSARKLVYADGRANPLGRLPDDTWILRPQDLADCFTPSEDTWYFPRVAGTFKERAGFHGCQMPEQLLGRIIRACSRENDLVLDPFAGSATTLTVAKKLGRRFLGFEVSEEYVQRGTDRLDRARLGDPLEGAPEPTVSAPSTAAGKVRGRPKTASTNRATAESNSTAASTVIGANTKLLRMTQRGLIAAFRSVSQGYSLDRVVADPELNQQLAEACRRLGIAGDARSWNFMLFRMRKAGMLADIPTLHRTEISWHDCDQYLYGSEIAWQHLLEQGCESLDEILCDPELAQEFDQIARRWAPGFTSLQYRWAALKLRKEAKIARVHAQALTSFRLRKRIPLQDRNWDCIPDSGVYLITGCEGRDKLYGGEALNLRRRLETQFAPGLLQEWQAHCGAELSLHFTGYSAHASELLAYQSRLIRDHRPRLNYLGLGVA